MPYFALVLALFLSLSCVTSPAAADTAEKNSGNAAANALKQAEEAANTMTSQQNQAGGQAAAQDSEDQGLEQTVYPGVRNRRLESGGNGEPSSSLWYPQFSNAAVDASLREFAEKASAGYENEVREGIGENGEKPESWSQWEQNGFFTLTRPSPDIASVLFNIYSYTGGAHGQIYIIALNFDLKTGKQLVLADLFGDVPQALKIMSEISAAKLRKALGNDTDEEMLADGTEAVEGNFNALSLTPSGVTVEFQPYQVGPWSIGQQHVDITLEELASAKPSVAVWPPRK